LQRQQERVIKSSHNFLLTETNMYKILLFIISIVTLSMAGIKYVAVVEMDIDMKSSDVAKLDKSEVRLLTDEIRDKAVNTLSHSQFNIMTTETVIAQGGAVLEECSEENCVITLGNKIGADYIVRGKLSKFQNLFVLSIVIYDTENGFLVASSNAIRSDKMTDLIDKVSIASENLFKKFSENIPVSSTSASVSISTSSPMSNEITTSVPNNIDESAHITNTDKTHDTLYIQTTSTSWANKIDWYIAPKYQFKYGTPVSWGGVNLEGGVIWGNGVFAGADFSFGMDGDYNWIIGGGINIGHVIKLSQFQFVYGGAAGYWNVSHPGYDYDLEKYSDTSYYYDNILAPYIKLRWRFLELTGKGLIGFYEKSIDTSNGSYDAGSGFNWNTYQLMLGFYFVKKKRAY